MAGSRFLLDTNIVIAFFAGDLAVTAKLASRDDHFRFVDGLAVEA